MRTKTLAIAAIALSLSSTGLLGQAPPTPPVAANSKPPAPEVRYVVDPTWRPRPGDVASIFSLRSDVVYVAFNYAAYSDMMQSVRAYDQVGIEKLAQRKELAPTLCPTRVLVLEIGDAFKVGNIRMAEVRFQEGTHNGEKAYVPEIWLARVAAVPIAQSRAAAKAKSRPKAEPKPKPVDPKAHERRAETLYQMGRNLEFESNSPAALENFKKVWEEFQDTPSAKLAGDRIKAITGKPPTPVAKP